MENNARQEFLSWRLLIVSLLLSSSTTLVIQCESRSLRSRHQRSSSQPSQMKALNHLDIHQATSDPYSFVGSPLSSLEPYRDVMGPSSSPQDYPPFCIYPPFTPLPPYVTPTTPLPFLQPPPSPESTNPPEYPVPSPPLLVPGPPEVVPNPPEVVPSPPGIVPNPPEVWPSPPAGVPGPPEFEPSPPVSVPSPTGFQPSPPSPPLGFVPSPPEFSPGTPIFLPPVVYPPPRAPPAPTVSSRSLWCVAKPTVPDPIIQEAMNYACGSGADCNTIQPRGACYQPDTLISHASFAFNSYWQRTKVAGGTCDFGGTAMLVTKDPSYDGCHFIIY